MSKSREDLLVRKKELSIDIEFLIGDIASTLAEIENIRNDKNSIEKLANYYGYTRSLHPATYKYIDKRINEMEKLDKKRNIDEKKLLENQNELNEINKKLAPKS